MTMLDLVLKDSSGIEIARYNVAQGRTPQYTLVLLLASNEWYLEKGWTISLEECEERENV